MGVDSVVKLKGHVSKEEILQFIQKHIDKDASIFNPSSMDLGVINNFSVQEYYGAETEPDKMHWKQEDCWFRFSEDNDINSIFYCYHNVNFYENLEFYECCETAEQDKLIEMVKSETTTLMVRRHEESTEVLWKIVEHFGGWFDANDCDDIPFIHVYGKGK